MLTFINNQRTIDNTATTTGVSAALLIALNLNMFLVAYILFTISSVLWSISAYRSNNRQLLTMNVIFTVINTIGLIRFS